MSLGSEQQGHPERTPGHELRDGVGHGNAKPFCELFMSLILEKVCPHPCPGDEVMCQEVRVLSLCPAGQLPGRVKEAKVWLSSEWEPGLPFLVRILPTELPLCSGTRD